MRLTSNRFQIWCGLGLLVLGLLIRWPHLNQSLWYDEMTTLVEFVIAPWSKVLAADAGEYVPNNHVLHTILAKIVYSIDAGGEAFPPREAVLRLPALIAGVLVPIALVWPMRKSDPVIAVLVAVVTTLNPWLVAFSVEARGYSLLLLLGILATHCLPNRPIFYCISLALAIYAVPLAVLLIPAHAVVVLVLHRARWLQWLSATCGALTLSLLLYLPMYRGLISYYSHPYPPTMDYRQFLDWLPRYAMAGTRLPENANPLAPPETGAIFWVLPTLIILFGSAVGWSRVSLRPLLMTLGISTLCGVVLPLLDPVATEVRFVPWILLWFCVSAAAAFCASPTGVGKFAGMIGIVALIGWQILQDARMLPNQPIREGIQLVDKLAPPGRDILVLYLGARESIALYGDAQHRLLPGPDLATMLAMQRQAIAETGHLPWIVVLFERQLRDSELTSQSTRGMWPDLVDHYHLACPRIPARLTPIAIYAPNEARRP